MPIFKAFKGVRPQEDYLHLFPTYPLNNFSKEEIQKKSQIDNTYIQMVKPSLLSKSKDVDRNLRKIRNNFEELMEEHKLVKDSTSIYLYEQTYADKRVFRGLLGLVAVEDFFNGKIKKHESTITSRKEKMASFLDKVHLQAEPVLLTYNANSKVELLMSHEQKNVPIVNFVAEDNTRHKIWKIDNRLKLQQFKEVFDHVDSFYIADGHHRIGSVAMYAKHQKEKNKKHNGTEHYNFVYSFIVSNQSIKIHDYNRLLKTISPLTKEEFLLKLEDYFQIHQKEDIPYYPSQKFHISMYLDGKFYSLHVKHDMRKDSKDGINMDHFLIENLIFKDILGISNPEESDKVTFIKGDSTIDGILKIKEKVDSGNYIAGFGIYPISFQDLLYVSNKNIKMPPKCTNIEPKLVTGLIMYDMK